MLSWSELPLPKEHSDLQDSPTPSPPPLQDDANRVSVEADSDTSDDTLVNVGVHDHLDDGSGKEISVEFHDETSGDHDIMVVDVGTNIPTA